MKIPAKELYKVESDGKFGGVVLVDPKVVVNNDGEFEIAYPAPTDIGILVDIAPPGDDYIWNGEEWAQPESAKPEAPPEKLYHRIDMETGMMIEPVIVQPGWVEDLKEWRYVVPPGFIDVPVDQTSGFYHPKWDFGRNKWVEGGEPPVIQPAIDWDAFVIAYTASNVDEVLLETSNQAALNRLNRLLSRAPNIDFNLLINVWNDCVNGLDEVTKAFTDEVIELAKNHNIPVIVDEDGLLTRPV